MHFSGNKGGEFLSLISPMDEHTDVSTIITTYNTTGNDAASEILGKERKRKKPSVTRNVFELCDERRDFKKKWYEAGGVKKYRKANKGIRR